MFNFIFDCLNLLRKTIIKHFLVLYLFEDKVALKKIIELTLQNRKFIHVMQKDP